MGTRLRNVLTEEDKKYICSNSQNLTVKELSQNMGVKEEIIRSFLFYHKLEYQRVYQSYRETLTPREKGVIELMAKGLNNYEIRDILCISLATLKTHIMSIYGKYGLSNDGNYRRNFPVLRLRAVLKYQQEKNRKLKDELEHQQVTEILQVEEEWEE
ncbi:TPA: hypothetical protein CPT95_00040 [Candidatus Gastranaerophilales bacterium HUM_15]|jgi:DNA-binding NarL/FixJ family response regulator|nr:MAG TPA: hypothetical protein CPT95_00040 [Candidatus Gastranaerophilales bacterium HUM_15]